MKPSIEAAYPEVAAAMGERSVLLEYSRNVQRRAWPASLLLMGAVFIGLLLGLAKYTSFSEDPQGQVDQYYQWFIHVNIMVFVGFGFLMTFLRRYSFGAVALNMVASAVVFLEAVLFVGASQQVFWNQDATHIEIGIKLLIDCSFCAASGMIAFGAVIGKTSPTQLLWLVIAQVPLYAVNQHLVIYTFKALDMGGSIVIHLFGAYYGLAASLMISRNQPGKGEEHPKSTGSYLNDIFSMVGTLFLWLYWPSFNGALASVGAHSPDASDAQRSMQFLCVVNTVFSLMGSTIATFAMSALVHQGKMNMIHVQNSTLAGGVAIGAACTLRMTPGGSVVVGAAAGAISVLGFTYLTPFLNRKIGLGDTCGVHNLHGMPAILAGLVAGLAALGQDSDFLNYSTGKMQLGYQVLAMVVTMGIAIGGGLVVGLVLSTCNPSSAPELMQHELFDDGAWWIGVQLEPLSHAFMTYDNSKHSNRSHHRAGDSSRHSNRSHQGAHGVGDTSSHHQCKPNPAKDGSRTGRWNLSQLDSHTPGVPVVLEIAPTGTGVNGVQKPLPTAGGPNQF